MSANLPAFPSHGSMGEVVETGLTKRELFAAMAMQGLCARPAEHRAEDVIPVSLSMADALLAELAKDSP